MRRDRLSLTQLKDRITAHGFTVTVLPAPNGMEGQGGFEIIAQGVYNGHPMRMTSEVPCTINMDYGPYLDLFYETLLSIPDEFIQRV